MKVDRKLRLALLPVSAMSLVPMLAQAQNDPDEVITPGGVIPAAVYGAQDPAQALTYNLGILARNPRDVSALKQAGMSALAVGDANAAIGFLGKAEQLSPSDGRIKLALGGALVMLERPMDALHFLDEAVRFGVPERDVLKDRGLAKDIKGDQFAAQADYALALRYGLDDEVTRRYALSLGISGDVDKALRLLEPLIRRQDQGAWRNRAFILAMNGDLRGAERIVEQVMPYGASATMMPFMRRLPNLTLAERARAVNFGSMPADAMARVASVDPESTHFQAISGRTASALTAPPPTPIIAAVAPESSKKRDKKRRRPGRDDDAQLALAQPQPVLAPAALPATQPKPAQLPSATLSAPSTRIDQRVGPVDPSRLPPEIRPGGNASSLRPVLVQQTSLPPPSGIAPVARSVATAAVSKPIQVGQSAVTPVAASIAPPPPVFELPSRSEPAKAAIVKPIEQPQPTLAAATPSSQITRAIQPQPSVVTTKAPQAALSAPVQPKLVVDQPKPVITAMVQSPVNQDAAPPVTTSAETTKTALLAAIQSPVATTVQPPAAANPPASAQPVEPKLAISGPPVPEGLIRTEVNPVTAPAAAPTPGFGPMVNATKTAVQVAEPQQGLAPASMVLASTAPSATAARNPEAKPPVEAEVPAGLASIVAGIDVESETNALALSEEDFRKARAAARQKVLAEAKAKAEADKVKAAADAEAKAEEDKKRLAELEKKKNPQRYWVQVATGSNRSGLPGTFKKLRDQAPDALKGLSSASVGFKATNRLLVGPFKSQAEARTKVNELAKKGISATTFTSDPGEEVARLSSK